MNKNITTVLIVKNNDLHDIEIPRCEGKLYVNEKRIVLMENLPKTIINEIGKDVIGYE